MKTTEDEPYIGPYKDRETETWVNDRQRLHNRELLANVIKLVVFVGVPLIIVAHFVIKYW